MSFGSGGGGEAARARMDEELRQQRISSGTSQIRNAFAKAFNPKHYDDLRGAVTKFYQPEVDRQYHDTLMQMQAALMRSGLFNSSIQTQRSEDLAYAQTKANAEVASRGIAAENQRKQEAAAAENSALNQLINTSDVGASMASAANLIRTNSGPTATPMLGQVFTDLGAGLATQADLERQGNARYNVFGRLPGWNSASRYTRNIG